jgi:trehalose 6-phosphate phosphatase
MQDVNEIETALSLLMNADYLFVGLDRDGTIIPHRLNPLESVIDRELSEIINQLVKSSRVIVAIISARALDVLEQDFGRDDVILAGVYGLEISIPGRELIVQEVAQNVVGDVRQIRASLIDFTTPAMGAIMERDAYSIWLGWRAMSEKNRVSMVQAAKELTLRFPSMTLNLLDDGLEIVPRTDWDKSTALETIISEVIPIHRKCSYIYAGDALADEPVFRWVNERGGLSIRVGDDAVESQATFKLKDIESARQFLRLICQLTAERF